MKYPLLFRRAARIVRSGSYHSRDFLAYRGWLTAREPGPYELGACNVTVDFELAWSRARRGTGVNSRSELLERGRRARAMLAPLLAASERFGIPLTFAIVGHVALAKCAEHADPPTFAPSWIGEPWYTLDPHTDLARDPLWYGADLIQKIQQGRVSHELASHGFSHVDLSDNETTREAAEFEIRESFRILKACDARLATFVFPKNHPAFLDLVARSGYHIVRASRQGPIVRGEHGLWQFPIGLWCSPQAASPRELLHLVDIAMRRRQLVNLWCHGYEFVNPQQVISFFRALFAGLCARARSGLAIATMRDIIERYHG